MRPIPFTRNIRLAFDVKFAHINLPSSAYFMGGAMPVLVYIMLLLIVGLLLALIISKQKNKRLMKENNRKDMLLDGLIADKRKLQKEKKWLIKELQHRVKNNFQMVTSLLYSQSIYVKHPVALQAVKDSLRRMQTMSLIHQKLYQDEHMSTVAMPIYIRDLVGYLRESLNTGEQLVFERAVDDIYMAVSIAAPLGLIITESIVNAVKHAFPNGQEGYVTIRLERKGPGDFLLKITDNGVGLPAGFDISRVNSLGFDLILGLTRQLNGSFSIENDNGVHITVRFTVPNNEFSEMLS
jgi:two-component sensor histidine kinase